MVQARNWLLVQGIDFFTLCSHIAFVGFDVLLQRSKQSIFFDVVQTRHADWLERGQAVKVTGAQTIFTSDFIFNAKFPDNRVKHHLGLADLIRAFTDQGFFLQQEFFQGGWELMQGLETLVDQIEFFLL